jgi:hypothetical protein
MRPGGVGRHALQHLDRALDRAEFVEAAARLEQVAQLLGDLGHAHVVPRALVVHACLGQRAGALVGGGGPVPELGALERLAGHGVLAPLLEDVGRRRPFPGGSEALGRPVRLARAPVELAAAPQGLGLSSTGLEQCGRRLGPHLGPLEQARRALGIAERAQQPGRAGQVSGALVELGRLALAAELVEALGGLPPLARSLEMVRRLGQPPHLYVDPSSPPGVLEGQVAEGGLVEVSGVAVQGQRSLEVSLLGAQVPGLRVLVALDQALHLALDRLRRAVQVARAAAPDHDQQREQHRQHRAAGQQLLGQTDERGHPGLDDPGQRGRDLSPERLQAFPPAPGPPVHPSGGTRPLRRLRRELRSS